MTVNQLKNRILKAGVLAYYDAFGVPPIPCKVLSITSLPGAKPVPSTKWNVRIRITTGNIPGYKLGEIMEVTAYDVIPRGALVIRSGQYRITHYTVDGAHL
jgi:hypothetical protein